MVSGFWTGSFDFKDIFSYFGTSAYIGNMRVIFFFRNTRLNGKCLLYIIHTIGMFLKSEIRQFCIHFSPFRMIHCWIATPSFGIWRHWHFLYHFLLLSLHLICGVCHLPLRSCNDFKPLNIWHVRNMFYSFSVIKN